MKQTSRRRANAVIPLQEARKASDPPRQPVEGGGQQCGGSGVGWVSTGKDKKVLEVAGGMAVQRGECTQGHGAMHVTMVK